MTIPLSDLTDASNGPPPSSDARPSMLTVGNSLMWGQGLRPENRFRELVRQRIASEFDPEPIVELAMARSGAKIDPANNPGTQGRDDAISNSIDTPPIEPIYEPTAFTREVPHSALTTKQQLIKAFDILDADANGTPEEIKWIFLDGGINDIGIFSILTPLTAFQEGYLLSGWPAWILDAVWSLEDEVINTLELALAKFENSTIVVNGYFPVFSYYSVANITKLQSVGLLYGVANLILTSPFGLDALATASTTWQTASNKMLRSAIRTVRRNNPGRTIVFARSGIEDSHALFGPDSWLWGYDAVPDDIPDSVDHWLQWLAGATPEDEVIDERIARCKVLATEASVMIPCRLASIGHPNVLGAVDYANAIIETLEDAGILTSSLGFCALRWRRSRRACKDFEDDLRYQCIELDSRIGKACAETILGMAGTTANEFREAGESLTDAGEHLQNAAACFEDTTGNMAQAAVGQFTQAGSSMQAAGEHLQNMVNCWDQTAEDMQACDDTEAADIASCNSSYTNTVNTTCNIQCNSYTNCSSYSRWNPYRYVCYGLRASCVAAAATARAVCITGAVAIREACKAAAWVKSAACKAGVVTGNIVCSGGEAAGAVVDTVRAVGHSVAGVGAAILTFGEDIGCALDEASSAGADVARGIGHGIAGTLLGGATIGVGAVCKGTQWILTRACRLGSWIMGTGCRAVSLVGVTFCGVTQLVRLSYQAIARRG